MTNLKSKHARDRLMTYALVISAFLIFQTLSSAGVLSRSLTGQLVPVCVYIVAAIALNLVVGISGELSLGHAGFFKYWRF